MLGRRVRPLLLACAAVAVPLTALAQEPSPPPTPEPSPSPSSPCLDFSSQQEAQTYFEAHGGLADDPYGLDPDGDGVACRGLAESVQDSDASSEVPLDEPTPSVELEVPVIPRTGPRNTSMLVERLEPLTEYGIPLAQVLVDGMGRFPVAGRAHYFDDWLNARYTPTPHLHEGLDIFADYGTPVRSPDAAAVERLSEDPSAGGTGVTLRTYDGTRYYFGHLQERAEWLTVGASVEMGTVIGFVGDTGNATGVPHLHLEIRRDGEPQPPKPTVDQWLDEATEVAPNWVEARMYEIEAQRMPPPTAEVVAADPGETPTPVARPAVLPTSVRSRAYGLAGLSLVLFSILCVSLARRGRVAHSARRPGWDEFSLIGW